MSAEHVLYSRKEAARYIGVSLSTIDVIVSRGLIRVRRLGRRVLIHQVELDRFVRADHAEIWPAKHNGKTTRIDNPQFTTEVLSPSSSTKT